MMGRPGAIGAVIALSSALLMTGCAAQNEPNPYATATAAELQQTVLHVTDAAGDGDFAAARTRLDELEVAAKVAHARGELTEARQNSILAAIALVRADLERLIAEQEAKAAAAQQEAEEQARREAEAKTAEEARQAAEAEAAKRAAEAEAAQQAAEAEAEQEAAANKAGEDDDDDENGKGNGSGNGKNKGNGKGKDD